MGRLVLEKLPLIGLALASSAITVLVQRAGGALSSVGALPLGDRVANASVSYVVYLWKTIWPAGLAVYYPHPAFTAPDVLWAKALGSAALLLTVTALVTRFAAARPYLIVGWLWYLLTLLPVIGLVQTGTQGLADRYAYLPLVGIYLGVVWLGRELCSNRVGKRWVLACGTLSLLALMIVTRLQVSHWRDSRALFEHAIAVTSHNHVAHNSLGLVLDGAGDAIGARRHYEEALRIRPSYSKAHNNLANVLAKGGELDRARSHYEEALRLDPGYAKAHNNLAVLLARRGDSASARRHYEKALEIRPDYAKAHNNLGSLLWRTGDLAGARFHYEQALQADPGYGKARENLARLEEELGARR